MRAIPHSQFATWLLVCTALALSQSACVQRPAPQPRPAGSVAVQAFREYQTKYLIGLRSLAVRIDQGEIDTADKLAKELAASNQSARLAAFQPVSNQLNDEVGGERWDRLKAAQHLRRVADELQKGSRR